MPLPALESNDKIAALFDKAFRLEYTVSLSKTALDTHLKITNLADGKFRFNMCLHTCASSPKKHNSLLHPDL